jgi:hypothetical protein
MIGSTSAAWRSSNTRIRQDSCAAGHEHSSATVTLSLLKDLNAGVSGCIAYQSREDEGTQSPTQTLDRGLVHGPGLCGPLRRSGAQSRLRCEDCFRLFLPSGSGHCGISRRAWAEVFVAGAGWITFDPTNRSVGGFNLIPVAVARNIRQAMPVGVSSE